MSFLVIFCIQSEYGKIRSKKISVFRHFSCDLFSNIKVPQSLWKEDNSIYVKLRFVETHWPTRFIRLLTNQSRKWLDMRILFNKNYLFESSLWNETFCKPKSGWFWLYVPIKEIYSEPLATIDLFVHNFILWKCYGKISVTGLRKLEIFIDIIQKSNRTLFSL